MANEVTVTSAANFIPEVWTSDILDIVKTNLVMSNLVHRYDSMAYGKGKGDIIHIPTITEISASAKSAGTDVTPTSNVETKVDLTVDQHYYAAIDIEDIVKVQALDELRRAYTDAIAYGVTKQMDTSLTELATGFSQTTGTAGTDVTDTVVLRAIQYLDDADAPMTDRHFVIKPAVKNDILALDKFVLFQNTGPGQDGSRVLTGSFGQVYGVNVHVTTNVTTTSGSPDTINNLMFHRDAIGMSVAMPMRVQQEYELRGLSNLMVADALWGVKETRDTFGVWVKA